MNPNAKKRATPKSKSIIGMVHVGALPGTPKNNRPLSDVVQLAVDEAVALAEAGFDAIILENMHDRPYLLREVGPEIVAGMTAAAVAVRAAVILPIGVQVLAGANRHALAVAQAGGAGFIRAEGFVFAHVADEGLMQTADAADLLRYRKHIGAEHIEVMADIKKKHSSHAITSDVDLEATAKAAEFFGAGGVVVTGSATGQPADAEEVARVKSVVSVPVLVGSGITHENLGAYWASADAFIVGSSIKKDGLWSNPLDHARVARLMTQVKKLRR